MKNKVKLPFVFTKKYWTEKGKDKKISEAKHNLAGEKLERKLIEIDYEDGDESGRERGSKISCVVFHA